MACIIERGRLLSCKDAVGGVKAVYFVNYGEPDVNNFVFGNDGEITDFGTTAPLPKAYKFDVKLGNKLLQNIQSSQENGTLYFEQVLDLTLKKLSKEDNYNIKQIAAGHPHVIVEDQMGNFWYAGLINGMDVSGGNSDTGDAMGDFNGYKITLTGMEREFANLIEGGLATVLSGFDIVEGV